jgi:hypothetical protein
MVDSKKEPGALALGIKIQFYKSENINQCYGWIYKFFKTARARTKKK